MKKLVILPLLFICLVSSATNYYIKNTGSDAANGLSDANAWASVSKVVSSMSIFQPGDSILFKKGGTWTNALLTIGRAGIAGKNIIISSYGSGAKPILSAQAGMPVIYVTTSGRGYWTVNDLDIRATTPPGGQAQSLGIYFAYWLSDLGPVPGWEIKNCKFNCSVLVSGPDTWVHNNTFAGDYIHSGNNKGGAIIVRGPEGDNCIIESNVIYGWTDRAIWIMRGGSNPIIRYNTAYDIWGSSTTDHAGTGVNIDGYGVAISGAKIYNNYVYNCTGLGLSLENAFGAEAFNNKFINCGWGGFSIYWYPEHQGEPSNVKIHHNIVRNGAWGVMINAASDWTIANNVFIKDDVAGATSDRNALMVNSPSTYISNGVFANNIIAGTGYVNPVKLPDTKNIFTLFDYNIIVPVGTEIVNRGGTPLSLSQVQSLGFMIHGSTADPKFVNPVSDWHLQSGSPAINTGTNLGYTKDFEGRSIDANPDMGAYEYAGYIAPAPQYVSSSVQSATPNVVEMTYNQTLSGIIPPASAFTVMVNSLTRTISSVAISGTKVLLTLSSPVTAGNTITVAYAKPATNPLQSTAGVQAADLSAQNVTNNVVAASLPVFTGAAVQSATPAVLEMTYNQTLANVIPSASAFSVMVNSVARPVSSVAISGSKVLLTCSSEFAYGNVVTVAYTKPATNPIQSTTGAQAAGLSAQPVTINLRAVPVYVSSAIQNTTPAVIQMVYNFPLENIVPAASAFSVKVDSLSRSVSSVAISGTNVLLTLSSPVSKGNVVTVSYTKPSVNPIQISSGGQAASITPQPVTNNVTTVTISSPPPVYSGSAVQNATPSVVEMTYNLTLANVVPPASAFTVMVNSVARPVSSVAISGSKVLLTCSSEFAYGNVVTVAYTKPATNPIQSTTGGLADNLTAQPVAINVRAVPVYVSSDIQNTAPAVLEMVYNFPLENIVPAASAFSVAVNSLPRPVSSVAISGTKVLLTLSSPVSKGNVVTVAYTKPSVNPIQISSGGQAVSITPQPVTNNVTTSSLPSPVYVSSVIQNANPSVIEMTYSLTLANIVPAASSFTVNVNSAARTVSSVSVSGVKVYLTLSSPVAYGNTVNVAYTVPSSNPLQTAEGGLAAALSAQSVLNYVNAVPTFVSAAVQSANPSILEMNYDFPLANIIPPASAFSVLVNSVNRTVNSVSISGTKVLLTLSSPAAAGNNIVVSYTKPSTNPIQISSGGQAASIYNKPVVNYLGTTKSAELNEITSAVVIYPNPVMKVLNIAIQDAESESHVVRILDFSGKLCTEIKIDNSDAGTGIPLNLKKGIYIVNVLSGTKIIHVQKLIVL